MTTDTLAYVAGILDSEGSISLGGSPVRPVLSLTMPLHATAVLKLAMELFGGTLWELPKKSPFTWVQWELEGGPAKEALHRMLPFLPSKVRQAQLAIYAALAETEPAEERELLEQMRALNAYEEPVPDAPLPGTRLLALRAGDHWVLPQRDLFSTIGWERLSGSWPESVIVERSSTWTANTTDWRSEGDGCSVCSLASILEPSVARKYYLSPMACAGILRRAAKRGKEIPPALHAALAAVAKLLPPGESPDLGGEESPEDSRPAAEALMKTTQPTAD